MRQKSACEIENIYKTVLRLIETYGAETWAIRKNEERPPERREMSNWGILRDTFHRQKMNLEGSDYGGSGTLYVWGTYKHRVTIRDVVKRDMKVAEV